MNIFIFPIFFTICALGFTEAAAWPGGSMETKDSFRYVLWVAFAAAARCAGRGAPDPC